MAYGTGKPVSLDESTFVMSDQRGDSRGSDTDRLRRWGPGRAARPPPISELNRRTRSDTP